MKVTFDFSSRQIAIEGDGPDLLEVLKAVRELAPNLPQISINAGGPATTGAAHSASVGQNGASTPAVPATSGVIQGGTTLRQFIKRLPIESSSAGIVAIAYYYKNHEGRDSFSPQEMGTWFTHAGLQKPKQMPVAVHYTKKKYGYLASAGYGKWRLTSNGENLVVGMLNRAEGAQE